MSVRSIVRTVVPALVMFLVAGCLFAVTYYHDNKYIAPPPYGSNGSIMLTDEDITRPISLVDGWLLSVDGGEVTETFIGQYSDFSYAPGGSSPFGTATYELTLHYQGSHDSRALVLLMPEVFTRYALFVDGNLVSESGDGAEVALVVDDETTVVLQVENSAHYYAGMVYPPVIGDAQAIAGLELANTVLSSVLVIVPLAAALFSFAVRRRSGDALVRDFGILCAALGVAGLHSFMWRTGMMESWWYAVEDAAWMAVAVSALSLAARAVGLMRFRTPGVVARLLWVLPLVSLVWVAVIIPIQPQSIAAYGLFQTAARLICWALFVVCAIVGLRECSVEARFILCGCAVLGAALVANLLDNNAYEPLRGLWQSEYAGLLLVGVFAWMLIARVRRLRVVQEQVRDLEAQVHAAETGLVHLKRGEEATRMARHDLRHHVGTIKQLIDAGEWERCRTYLNDLSQSQETEPPLHYAENMVVNAVMAAYLSPAQGAGVRVTWDVNAPEQLGLRSTELVVLLSNLLSNAVEACERARAAGEAHPFVSLAFHVEGRCLAIRCENSAAPDASFATTSKSDPANHGLGLPAMRHIVENHRGALFVDIEGNKAVVRIMLNMDESTELT